MRNLWMCFFLMVFFLCTTNAYARLMQYVKFDTIAGKVIDIDTLEPLEGVIVVAVWGKAVGFEGNKESYYIEEAVTDKAGKFKLDKWEPKYVFNESTIFKKPNIVFFKEGYRFEAICEYGDKSEILRSQRYKIDEVYKTGVIKLEKFEGDARSWGKELSAVKIALVGAGNLEYDMHLISRALSEERKKVSERLGVTESKKRRVY